MVKRYIFLFYYEWSCKLVTRRALLLGFALGLFIAGFAYFNDAVIGSTFLIGNFLPVGIFGPLLLLLLLVNPLLVKLGMTAFSGRELAVATAIGLAACAWPGSNFYRGAHTIVAKPKHMLTFQSGWQANQIMSYVPGERPLISPGQVRDWTALARLLSEARDTTTVSTVMTHLYAQLDEAERVLFEQAAMADGVGISAMQQLAAALNRLLVDPGFYDATVFETEEVPSTLREEAEALDETSSLDDVVAVNRALLQAVLQTHLVPPPTGGRILLNIADEDRVMGPLLEGGPAEGRLGLSEIPWDAWWPTMSLWGGITLALALATVCLALIVHRQWSRNELLSYPIARFVEEWTVQEPGSKWPTITCTKIFWVGFAIVLGIRLLNGSAHWNNALPSLDLRLDFRPLLALFPNARQVPLVNGVFHWEIMPAVIGFAFFLDSRISFSLGLTNLFWVVMGSMLVANGIALDASYLGAERANLIRFGAYLGIVVMIVYTGRRYYREVFLSAIGMRRGTEVPSYACWAARGFVGAVILAVWGLQTAGLTPLWAAMITLLILIIFLVMSRIVAESGLFFMQPYWMPAGIMVALLGFEAMGPTQYIVLAVASVLLAGDPRTTLMPFLVNGLKLIHPRDDATSQQSPGRGGICLLVMVVLSFVVAGMVTLYWQYNVGFNRSDPWAFEWLPVMPFDQLNRNLAELASRGDLSRVVDATAETGWGAWAPQSGAIWWAVTGGVLVLVFATARLRFTWWPFHPIIFLVWGTYPISLFGGSFLLGWAIKEGVVRTMGARGFHQVKPLMVGLVAAEVMAALIWALISLFYYLRTGLSPETYFVFPG